MGRMEYAFSMWLGVIALFKASTHQRAPSRVCKLSSAEKGFEVIKVGSRWRPLEKWLFFTRLLMKAYEIDLRSGL